MITGGDDYELLLTAPPDATAELERLAQGCGVPLTPVGRMEDGAGVLVSGRDGAALMLAQRGYQHF